MCPYSPLTACACVLHAPAQARAARRAAADAYLSAVLAAAQRHDIQGLLQQLSSVAAAPSNPHSSQTAATISSEASTQLLEPSGQQQAPAQPHLAGTAAQRGEQPSMSWLLPAALTLAARQLASGPGGKPEFAQALVELVLDQGLLEPQRAQRAVHAVLQAYYDCGNYAGVSQEAWCRSGFWSS